MQDSYNRGEAFKIPAMASKSCNAVSARDLYVPLSASNYKLTDNGNGNRTYSFEIQPYVFFGTRINVEVKFLNMSINGNRLSDAEINAWVAADGNGKPIGNPFKATGSYNYEGKPDRAEQTFEITGAMEYYTDVGCTKTKTIIFRNTITVKLNDIAPYYTTPALPTLTSSVNLDASLIFNVKTTSFGEGGGKYLYVEVSRNSTFSNAKRSNTLDVLSGECRVDNLQRNTRYYYRVICSNNGRTAIGTTGQLDTLAASEITDIYPSAAGSVVINGIVFNGGAVNQPTTTMQVSYDKGKNWSSFGIASTSTTTFSGSLSGLAAGTTIYVRAQTKTEAGIYESPYVVFNVPTEPIWGRITSITPSNAHSAIVNFTANQSGSGNITATVYYRPTGMEEEWVSAGSVTFAKGASSSVTITGLVANYAEYEVSINFKGASGEFDTEPKQFYTIPLWVENHTCESLEYLVQLICQTLNAIKQGNIVIYMNDDTKEWCEGEDGIPTLASIMSRVNRFMDAVGCVLCSMEGFIELLKDSSSNQVFMGQMGWVDCEDEVKSGSLNPVLSGAIKQAIEEMVKQVWHYVGAYDYYGRDLAELQAQKPTKSGATGIVGDKVYTWNGSSWGSAKTGPQEDFGVIHINSGTHAEKAYYWFVDSWNRLDADTDEVEDRIKALESLTMVRSYDSQDYKIVTLDSGLTTAQINSQVPTDATSDIIIVMTSPSQADETKVEVLTS